MKILDKALENNRNDGFDYSHMPINAFHANINSFLILLDFVLDLTLTLDQNLTLVSNIILL